MWFYLSENIYLLFICINTTLDSPIGIYGLNIQGCNTGIYFKPSIYTSYVESTTFSNNKIGIIIDSTTVSILSSNFTLNSQNGIIADGSGVILRNSQFFNNNFTVDQYSAVKVDSGTQLISQQNKFYNNYGVASMVMQIGYQSEVTSTLDIFQKNIAYGGNTIGGIIYAEYKSILSMKDCEFKNNTGRGVVGLYDGSTASFTTCLFDGNSGELGGAIFVSGATSLSINSCKFFRNQAMQAGGSLYLKYISRSSTIISSTFNNNYSPQGGAVFQGGSNITFSRCNFSQNTAESGGAFWQRVSSTTFQNCNFLNNTAEEDSGGVLFQQDDNNTVVFDKCVLTNNNAISRGGGLYLNNGKASVTNCTFQDNTVRSAGGAIFATSTTNTSSLDIKQSQILRNSAAEMGKLFISFFIFYFFFFFLLNYFLF